MHSFQSTGAIETYSTGKRLVAAVVALLVIGSGLAAGTASASAAQGEVYGAVAIRDDQDALVPGVNVLIRRDACSTGAPVWQNTTSTRSDAFGAFAFTLSPGQYCAEVMSVPGGFKSTAPQTFTVTNAGPAWKTTWIPRDPSVRTTAQATTHRGIIATRNAYSQALPGIGVRIHQNACASNGTYGTAVWETVTPSRPDAYGSFAFTLPAGQYCVITSSVPDPYKAAQPQTMTLGSGSPASTSLNLWLPGPPMPDFAVRLMALVNGTREAAGKAPLTYSAGISAVSQQWSNQMASNGNFVHNPSFASQMPAGWRKAGENIAWRRPSNVDALHKQLVASPGHYANIIGDFSYIGFGYTVDSSGSGYLTENFGLYSNNPG